MAEAKRRPWWAAALLGGGAAGASIVAALRLGTPAVAHDAVAAPVVTVASPALPPGSISLDDRLKSIEATLKTLGEDMAEVKRRLPKP